MPNTNYITHIIEVRTIYEVVNIVLWTYLAACVLILCVTDIDSSFTSRILERIFYIAAFLLLTLLAEAGELAWRRQIERAVAENPEWQH